MLLHEVSSGLSKYIKKELKKFLVYLITKPSIKVITIKGKLKSTDTKGDGRYRKSNRTQPKKKSKEDGYSSSKDNDFVTIA